MLMAVVSTWEVDKKRFPSLHCLVLGIVRDGTGMVRKTPCCIATVRVDALSAIGKIFNSLFQIVFLCFHPLACRLRVQMR